MFVRVIRRLKKRSKRVQDIVGQNVVGNVYSGDPDVDVDGQQNLGVGCKTVLRLWDLNWGVVCISALARPEYVGFTQRDMQNIDAQCIAQNITLIDIHTTMYTLYTQCAPNIGIQGVDKKINSQRRGPYVLQTELSKVTQAGDPKLHFLHMIKDKKHPLNQGIQKSA